MNAPGKLPPEMCRPVSDHLQGVLAVLTCPCHLSILAAALTGVIAGTFPGEHQGAAALALIGLSALAVTRLLRAFRGGLWRVRGPPNGRRPNQCRRWCANSLTCITSRWSICAITGSLARKH